MRQSVGTNEARTKAARGQKWRENRCRTADEIREAIRATTSVTAAARLLGMGRPHLSERLNSPVLRAWWERTKACRSQMRRAARRRRSWNRTRDRRLLAWLRAHPEGLRARRHLSTRLRARAERALTREGVRFAPL